MLNLPENICSIFTSRGYRSKIQSSLSAVFDYLASTGSVTHITPPFSLHGNFLPVHPTTLSTIVRGWAKSLLREGGKESERILKAFQARIKDTCEAMERRGTMSADEKKSVSESLCSTTEHLSNDEAWLGHQTLVFELVFPLWGRLDPRSTKRFNLFMETNGFATRFKFAKTSHFTARQPTSAAVTKHGAVPIGAPYNNVNSIPLLVGLHPHPCLFALG